MTLNSFNVLYQNILKEHKIGFVSTPDSRETFPIYENPTKNEVTDIVNSTGGARFVILNNVIYAASDSVIHTDMMNYLKSKMYDVGLQYTVPPSKSDLARMLRIMLRIETPNDEELDLNELQYITNTKTSLLTLGEQNDFDVLNSQLKKIFSILPENFTSIYAQKEIRQTEAYKNLAKRFDNI